MKIFTQKSFTRKLIISIICIVLLNFCMAPSVQAAGFGGKMMKYMRQFATALTDVAATTIQLGLTGKWMFAVDNEGSGSTSGENYWIKDSKFRYPVLQVSPELIFANKIQMLDVNFISEVKDASDYAVSLEDNTPLKTLRTIIATWYVTLRTIAVVGLLSVLIYIGIRIIISSTSEKAKYKERLVDWVIAFCLLFFMHYIMAATVTVVEKVNDMLGEASGVSEGIEIPSEYGTVKYNGTVGLPSMGSGNVSVGGTYSYTGNTNEEVIEKVKNDQGEPINESNVWTEIYNDYDFLSGETTLRYKYTLEYSDGIVEIIKEMVNSNAGSKIEFFANSKRNSSTSNGSSGGSSNGTKVSPSEDKVLYFTNYARLFLNVKDNDEYIAMSVAYLIIYIALVTFTAVFTFRYIKRVIYIAFLTMIAPVVAITYPLDKIKDNKAQAWNMWFKEYVFNVLIQPFHMILYTILVGSALELAHTSMIYSIVAIYFLIPAEKLLRKFFGFDNAGTLSAAGSFAGGAIFSAMINKMNRPKQPADKEKDDKPKMRKPTTRKENDPTVNPDDVLFGGVGRRI